MTTPEQIEKLRQIVEGAPVDDWTHFNGYLYLKTDGRNWKFYHKGWCSPCEPVSGIQSRQDVEDLIAQYDEIESLRETLRKANLFVNDVMPQIGKLTIQDFGNLNECLIEMSEALNNG